MFKEYLELDAKLNKLEHLEHIREFELLGDNRSLLTGSIGSMLLDEDDVRKTLVNARTVSHFLRLAKLDVVLIDGGGASFLLTKGAADSAIPAPLFLRRVTSVLRPGIANKSRALLRLCPCVVGA